jgi:hypothetical protein
MGHGIIICPKPSPNIDIIATVQRWSDGIYSVVKPFNSSASSASFEEIVTGTIITRVKFGRTTTTTYNTENT